MAYTTILTDLTDSIFTLTLNRPDKLNALNDEMYHALSNAIRAAQADSSVRVMVITGAGDAFVGSLAFFLARGHDCRTVDLRRCRIDLSIRPHGLFLPGFARGLPEAAFVRGVP